MENNRTVLPTEYDSWEKMTEFEVPRQSPLQCRRPQDLAGRHSQSLQNEVAMSYNGLLHNEQGQFQTITY
jgi:hypothetical protein